MNASRTITLTFGYAEIVEALKATYTDSFHVQGIPVPGGSGVEVATTAGKGLTLKYSANVGEDRQAKPMLLIGSGV